MKPVNNLASCGRFDDDLKAYIDGELPLLKRLQVRAHVARCPQCQKELTLMQTIENEVRGDVMAPLESDLRAKILQEIPVEAITTDHPAFDYPVVETPIGISKPKNRKKWGSPFEYATILGVFCVVGIGVLSVMGNRIQNTFNKAANSLAGDDYTPSMSIPPASSGAAPSAPSFAEPVREDARDSLDFKRNSAEVNAGPGTGIPITNNQRSVHKEGSLTVSVDNAENAGSSVEILVKNAGGFVANNALNTGVGGLRSATLDVRVPVANFEAIVKKIGALGTVRAKTINGEDVTARVAVANARKATLSNELSLAQARLRKLNGKFKPNSPEIYQSRAEVRNLNLQAAAAKAELDTLRRFAALSTLYVTLQDKGKTPTPASFSGSISETGNEAWSSFLNSARLPIQLIIWILAYSPLWVPALILWRKFGRRLVLRD